MAQELTKSEQSELIRHEKIIGDGLQSFVEVGNALGEIQEKKLHRATHNTFEEYVRERWGMSRPHAYRLIQSAETVEMSPIGDTIKIESVARELGQAKPETHRAVVRAAKKEHGSVTAESIKDVLDRVLPKARMVQDKPKPAKPKPGSELVPPKALKEARHLFGKLLRLMDRMGLTKDKKVDAAMEVIAVALKEDRSR